MKFGFIFATTPDSTEVILWSAFIGVILATIAMFCHKYFLGTFVSKLVKEGADSPESAKSLEELSFKHNFVIKSAISDGKPLRKMLGYRLGEETFEDPFAPLPRKKKGKHGFSRKDLSEAKFYLLPEKKHQATTRFDAKGSGPVTLIVCLVLIVAAFFLFKDIIPGLLEALRKSYSGIGS